ncbi:MAG: hypothetical protein JNM65_04515 [Verrucomicrobiaceae bacterium]|nr:hypothetical protein [Verrucomicrobiaceae bacterium]
MRAAAAVAGPQGDDDDLVQWTRRLNWKETATVFKVSWGLAHRDLTGIEAIGLDELHRGRGKKSANDITLIYQIDAGCRRHQAQKDALEPAASGEASEGQGADET